MLRHVVVAILADAPLPPAFAEMKVSNGHEEGAESECPGENNSDQLTSLRTDLQQMVDRDNPSPPSRLTSCADMLYIRCSARCNDGKQR